MEMRSEIAALLTDVGVVAGELLAEIPNRLRGALFRGERAGLHVVGVGRGEDRDYGRVIEGRGGGLGGRSLGLGGRAGDEQTSNQRKTGRDAHGGVGLR